LYFKGANRQNQPHDLCKLSLYFKGVNLQNQPHDFVNFLCIFLKE
jgi:hypothetical protein